MKRYINRKTNYKIYLLIFVPLILGYLINTEYFNYRFPLFLSIGFLMFWFWAGMKFADLYKKNIPTILIGNSLNIISFIIFYWSFYYVLEEERNLLLASFSQFYAIPTLSISSHIYDLTKSNVYTNEYVAISYFLMAVVFITGYVFRKIRQRRIII